MIFLRIAQISLHGYYNYGNILQKYALHRTLKKFSDFTEVVWYDVNSFFSETGNFNGVYIKNLPAYAEISQLQFFLREAVRENKFKEFENRYIKTRFNAPYFEEIADDYDLLIIGSDQVWNPSWVDFKNFLYFAPNEKKVAYAASIGAPKIPDEMKEIYKTEISSFAKISVREPGAVKILEELIQRKVELVLDPVMLLTKKEWLEIAKRPSWLNEKYDRGYILTYYLRDDAPPVVETLSKKLNLPVINLFQYRNYWHYTVGPEEFVYLFANASLIYTNSFHAVAFSVLFKKIFVNHELPFDFLSEVMSLRIPGLLKMFDLEDRIANSENDYKISNLFEIDYSTRDKILPVERAKSFRFLTDAIQGGGMGFENRKNDFKKILRLLWLRSVFKYLSEKLYFYEARRRRL